jgi:alpha-methylacyl-CoA racemase
VSLAAVETKFYAEALRVLELTDLLPCQWQHETWQMCKTRLAERFSHRTQAQWCEAFAGTESCFAPVLALDEAPYHPHMAARGTYVEVDGVIQPAPAPRFSRTPSATPTPYQPWSSEDAHEILDPWMDNQAIEAARAAGVIT